MQAAIRNEVDVLELLGDEPSEKPTETAGFAAEHMTTVSAAAAIHHDTGDPIK